MRKTYYLYLTFLSLFVAPIMGQSSEVLIPNYSQAQKPPIKRIAYSIDHEKIVVEFNSFLISIEGDPLAHQKILIKKDSVVLLQEEVRYPFDGRYLHGIYCLQLDSSGVPFLLVSSGIVGASGYSANMSHGLLISLDGKVPRIQVLSSWGMIEDNFVDISHEGKFSFVCIDFIRVGMKYIFVPNFFSLSERNIYENRQTDIDNVQCYVVDKDNKCWTRDFNAEIKLLPTPDMLQSP